MSVVDSVVVAENSPNSSNICRGKTQIVLTGLVPTEIQEAQEDSKRRGVFGSILRVGSILKPRASK